MDSRKVVSNDGQPDRGALLPAKEQCASVGLIAGLHPVRAVEFQAEKPISFAATYRCTRIRAHARTRVFGIEYLDRIRACRGYSV